MSGLSDPDQKTGEELAQIFRTDLQKGLSSSAARDILERDGPNELLKAPKPTLLMLFVMQLTGFVILLLLAAAVASIAVNATGPNKG